MIVTWTDPRNCEDLKFEFSVGNVSGKILDLHDFSVEDKRGIGLVGLRYSWLCSSSGALLAGGVREERVKSIRRNPGLEKHR